MAREADYSASLNTLLNNFQHNFGPLSDLCIDKIRHSSVSLWTRYCLDFIISHFIIAPAVIAFWRGTWDHSTIYWKTVFGDVSEQRRGFKSLQSNLDCSILKALNKKNKVLTVKTDAKSISLV